MKEIKKMKRKIINKEKIPNKLNCSVKQAKLTLKLYYYFKFIKVRNYKYSRNVDQKGFIEQGLVFFKDFHRQISPKKSDFFKISITSPVRSKNSQYFQI